MGSPQQSRRVGAAAEQQVCDWLRAHGFPHAERRHLSGANDRGDVAGMVGICCEVKAERRTDLAGWLAELQAEQANTGDPHGLVIAKRRGTLDVGRWYAVTSVEAHVRLLQEAGYGTPPEVAP